MLSRHTALVIVATGLLTFGVVFSVLQFSRSEAAPADVAVVVPPSTPGPLPVSPESLASGIQPGQLAVGVPISGSEALLKDVQPGDRLSVLASLVSAQDGRVVTAVVVSGATVLRPATVNDPLILVVSAPDAMVLAHLVLGGTHLGYSVWPAGANSPPESPPLDEGMARTLLGLTPLTIPVPLATAVPAALVPTMTSVPLPVATSGPSSDGPVHVGGFLYQVQAGDTWDGIAALFGVSVTDLRSFNEGATDRNPVPGTLLTVPRGS